MSQTLLIDPPVSRRSVTSPTITTRKFSFRKHAALLVLLVCALQCLLITLGVRVLLAGSYTTDLAGIETNVIYSIQMLLDSGRLYSNPGFIPFSITPYTPLYYYLCAAIAKLTIANPSADVYQLYVIGRWVNIIINTFTAVAVFLIVRRFIGGSPAVAAIAAFTAFIVQYGQNYAVGPDSLHDGLALWAIYAMLLYLASRNECNYRFKALATAVCLGVLAMFARQNGIQIPLILGGFLLFAFDWRGLGVAIVTAIVSGGLLLLLFTQLYGEAFLQNVVGVFANGINVKVFVLELLKVVDLREIPFVILKLIVPAGIAVYFSFRKWLVFRGPVVGRFLAFATLGTLVFATLSTLQVGAAMHYYYVAQVLTLLLVIYSLWGKASVNVSYQENRLQKLAGGFLLVLLLFQVSGNVLLANSNLATEWKPETEEILRIQKYLQEEEDLQAGEYIFANVAEAERAGINNFMYRHAVVPQPGISKFLPIPLIVSGYRQLEQQLQNGTIKYLIESESGYNFMLPNLQSIKQRYYKPAMHFENYRVYKYRGESTALNKLPVR